MVDVTFSTETFKNTEKVGVAIFHAYFYPCYPLPQDYKFTDLLISTALTAIERDLGLKIDRKHVRRMKFDYKGIPQPAIIRKKKVIDNTPNSQNYTQSKMLVTSLGGCAY